jgi:hypothetical protein
MWIEIFECWPFFIHLSSMTSMTSMTMFVCVWQVGVKDNGVFWMDWDEQLGLNFGHHNPLISQIWG